MYLDFQTAFKKSFMLNTKEVHWIHDENEFFATN